MRQFPIKSDNLSNRSSVNGGWCSISFDGAKEEGKNRIFSSFVGDENDFWNYKRAKVPNKGGSSKVFRQVQL